MNFEFQNLEQFDNSAIHSPLKKKNKDETKICAIVTARKLWTRNYFLYTSCYVYVVRKKKRICEKFVASFSQTLERVSVFDVSDV